MEITHKIRTTLCIGIAWCVVLFSARQLIAQQGDERPERKPKVLIVYSETISDGYKKSHNVSSYGDLFLDRFAALLKEKLPCAIITTTHDIRDLLSWDRQKSLLIGSSGTALEEIAGAFGADFVIALSVIEMNGTFLFGSTALDMRAQKAIARKSQQGADEESLNNMVENAVSGMVLPEICPFIGTIKATTKYSEDTTTSSGNYFTNSFGTVGQEKESHSINTELTDTWTVEKVSKHQVKGEVKTKEKSKELFSQITTNTNCFKKNEDGSTNGDDRYPSPISENTKTTVKNLSATQSFKGGEVKVAFLPGHTGEYYISFEKNAIPLTGGTLEESESATNACESTKSPAVKGTYYRVAQGSFIIEAGGGKETDQTLSGKKTWKQKEAGGKVTEIFYEWNLHR